MFSALNKLLFHIQAAKHVLLVHCHIHDMQLTSKGSETRETKTIPPPKFFSERDIPLSIISYLIMLKKNSGSK